MNTHKFHRLHTPDGKYYLTVTNVINTGSHQLQLLSKEIVDKFEEEFPDGNSEYLKNLLFLFIRANSDNDMPRYLISSYATGATAFSMLDQTVAKFEDYARWVGEKPDTTIEYYIELAGESYNQFKVRCIDSNLFWKVDGHSVTMDKDGTVFTGIPMDEEIALPIIEESGDLTIQPPELTNPGIAPEVEGPHASRVTWLPYHMVQEDDHNVDDGGDFRIQTSPYYSLERRVTYFSGLSTMERR